MRLWTPCWFWCLRVWEGAEVMKGGLVWEIVGGLLKCYPEAKGYH